MVILIDSHEIKDHPPEHLFNLKGVLGKISGQREEMGIVDVHILERRLEKGGSRKHMDPVPGRIDVEPLDGKILSLDKPDTGNPDATLPGSFHVKKFRFSKVQRIICVPEFDQPVRSVFP